MTTGKRVRRRRGPQPSSVKQDGDARGRRGVRGDVRSEGGAAATGEWPFYRGLRELRPRFGRALRLLAPRAGQTLHPELTTTVIKSYRKGVSI